MAGKRIIRDEILEQFLQKGGVLLRKDVNSDNEPVILHKKKHMDWHIRLTFSSIALRDKNFNYLTEKQKKFFRRG